MAPEQEMSQEERIALAKEAIYGARGLRTEPEPEEEPEPYVLPFPAPNYDPDPEPTTTDLIRKLLVSVSAIGMAFTAGLVFGPHGVTAPEKFPHGYFAADYSALSLFPETHLMWLLLMVGALTHAVFQWWPTQTSTPRQRRSGYYVAGLNLSAVLWLLGAHLGWALLAFTGALAGAVCGWLAIRELNRRTARYNTERLCTDAPIGLYAGWFLALTATTLAVLLTSWKWDLWIPDFIWALIAVALLTWLAAHLCMTERGRVSVALGVGAGLAGIMIARLFGEHNSVWVALLAGSCAFVLLLVTENRRYRIKHAEHRAQRGLATEFDE
ncbi:hypothetical protein [Micrococcoides hystricis]|uniref:DUF2157 domain-containing protein n=1 Tax=Micrococcoides hystricis TaxID=1572761 RepID=A0ABV6PAU8_9MICC